MQSCARTFAEGIESFDARLSVEVNLDTSAHIVGSRTDGDVISSDIDTHRQTFLVDVGEVVTGFFGRLVRHVQTDVINAVNLHLLVNSTGNNVAWSQ